MALLKALPKQITAGIAIVGLLTACGASDDDSGAQTTTEQTIAAQVNPVQISGVALAPAPRDSGDDPAIGAIAPTIAGTDIGGNPIEIGDDGRAKAVVFVAHWCPHCRREVPVLAQLVADGELPEGLDLYLVSTAVFSDRDNYPPSKWLNDVGIDVPVMTDSGSFEALAAFGSGAFPYTVYLNADHEVTNRVQGEAEPAVIKALWLETAGA